MKFLAHWAFAISLSMFTNAYAVEMPKLAKQKGCTTCHAIDKKVVGPAWSEVAKRYRKGDPAESKLLLSSKMVKGSKGAWGSIPMPPQAVSVDESKELTKFILSL